jgi:hypothetical protein
MAERKSVLGLLETAKTVPDCETRSAPFIIPPHQFVGYWVNCSRRLTLEIDQNHKRR